MNTKHTAYDLKQMQSLPLEVKVEMTKRRIREWYEYWDGQVYVSFSGGKDSTVLKHIVDSIYDDVPAVFVNTGLEYPEIQKFVHDIQSGVYPEFNSDVVILRPEKRFDQVIQEYGYPVISKEVSLCIRYARKGSKWAIDNFHGLNNKGEHSAFKLNHYTKWECMTTAPFGISNQCCEVMKEKPMKVYQREREREINSWCNGSVVCKKEKFLDENRVQRI